MAKIKLTSNNVETVLSARSPSRISDFPEERLAELDLMLFEGKGIYQIATFVQKEWGYFKGKTNKTVSRHIQAYKESPLCASRLSDLEKAADAIVESRFDRKIDVMKEMEDLFVLQKERLTRAKQQEDKMPNILMKQVTDAARDLKQTGEALAKLQMAAGVIAKAPTKVTGVVTDEGGKQHAFSWTASTAALYEELERLDGAEDK